MKTLLRNTVIVFVSLFMTTAVAFADNDKPVEINQLPKLAQNIISKHFSGKQIAMTTVEQGIMDKEYDVVFTDGNKIEFDRKGHWTSIDCDKSQVPAPLVPAKIAKYVNSKYAGQRIEKIEKDNREYEIELSNGLEITFNKHFKVVEIDRD